jgi:hypothetical protein
MTPWCPTCGKPTDDGLDCASCEQWWKDNPPPAQVDRSPKGQDNEDWLDAKHESAVAKRCAQRRDR